MQPIVHCYAEGPEEPIGSGNRQKRLENSPPAAVDMCRGNCLGGIIMKVVCCVCERVKRKGQWVEGPAGEDDLVSHGYCPDCAATARIELLLLRLRRLAASRPQAAQPLMGS